MVGWRCNACGKIHVRNPRKCKRCGNTILQQRRGRSRYRVFLFGLIVGGATVFLLVSGGGIQAPLDGSIGPALSNVSLSGGGQNSTDAPETEPSEPGPSASNTETPARDGDLEPATIEEAIHREINQVRSERDLSSIEFDSALREAARMHSQDMAENDYFDHEAPDGTTMEDRLASVGYNCHASAENIAMRTALGDEDEIAEGIVAQWMSSQGHRENILRPYWNMEGIGVAIDDGEVYATQNFC